MRENAEAIYAAIEGVAGIRLRQRPDPRGDIGYGVFFEVRDRSTQDRWIAGLRERHVPASTLTGSVLLPLEESVIQKRTRHPDWPSFNSPAGKAIEYGAGCCPQTLGIFDRVVRIRIGPKYTRRINDHIIEAIRKVGGGLV